MEANTAATPSASTSVLSEASTGTSSTVMASIPLPPSTSSLPTKLNPIVEPLQRLPPVSGPQPAPIINLIDSMPRKVESLPSLPTVTGPNLQHQLPTQPANQPHNSSGSNTLDNHHHANMSAEDISHLQQSPQPSSSPHHNVVQPHPHSVIQQSAHTSNISNVNSNATMSGGVKLAPIPPALTQISDQPATQAEPKPSASSSSSSTSSSSAKRDGWVLSFQVPGSIGAALLKESATVGASIPDSGPSNMSLNETYAPEKANMQQHHYVRHSGHAHRDSNNFAAKLKTRPIKRSKGQDDDYQDPSSTPAKKKKAQQHQQQQTQPHLQYYQHRDLYHPSSQPASATSARIAASFVAEKEDWNVVNEEDEELCKHPCAHCKTQNTKLPFTITN